MRFELFGQLLPLALLCIPAVSAQEGMAPPSPAEELQKLAPFVGNWAGTGEANFVPGAPPTKWSGKGTYRWSHDQHFLQEDFEISFQGFPASLVMRSYLGWDRERNRYAKAKVTNDGRAELQSFQIMPDGTLYEVLVQHQQGVAFAERSTLKVTGGKLVHTIDLMTPEGVAKVVTAEFQKSDKPYEATFDAATFMGGEQTEAMKKLARLAGVYDVKGTMIMMPGMPPMTIGGTDTFRTGFGGTILTGHTDGTADGMPGKYVSDAYFGWSEQRNCIVSIAVSNMGEIMESECRFADEDKALVFTSAGSNMGQPMAMRYVIELDANGAVKKGVGHFLMGTAAPYEGFNATYTKKLGS